MEKLNPEIEKILTERFYKDSLIALATVSHGVPAVRVVDAFYENKASYVLTHALTGEMKQIAENPHVVIAGDWFTANGTGVNLGYFGNENNARIASKMRELFAAWIDNGHNNFEDENTCILETRLKDVVLSADGKRYEIDFS